MTFTKIATAHTPGNGGINTVNLTVPAGVTNAHLGIIVIVTGANGASNFSLPGWKRLVLDPAGQNNHEVAILTRLGGAVAGNTLTITMDDNRIATASGVWYDTDGRKIESVGATWTRDGVSMDTVQIPGIVGGPANREYITVGTHRTSDSGVITAWSPSEPTPDLNIYSTSGAVNSGVHIGHYTGNPTDYTFTVGGASGNASGTQLLLAPPAAWTYWNGAAEAPIAFEGIYDGASIVPGNYSMTPGKVWATWDYGMEGWAAAPASFDTYDATVTHDTTIKRPGSRGSIKIVCDRPSASGNTKSIVYSPRYPFVQDISAEGLKFSSWVYVSADQIPVAPAELRVRIGCSTGPQALSFGGQAWLLTAGWNEITYTYNASDLYNVREVGLRIEVWNNNAAVPLTVYADGYYQTV